jgi:aminoglycoside phosphotransferase (APT) family kinase protein
LPLEIPIPIAAGRPTARYQLPWSVYRWLEGEDAAHADVRDLTGFAMLLAKFLDALQAVDPYAGPVPGEHNFFRGGPLTIYDDETRRAIATLRGHIDVDAVTAVWDEALRSTWETDPVWIHGDVAASNLLVRGGSLAAVIDFGCSGVGDPACDLTIAWTLFAGESRTSFRNELQLDGSMWARARGWAMWKGLITLVDTAGADTPEAVRAQRVIDVVVADQRAAA